MNNLSIALCYIVFVVLLSAFSKKVIYDANEGISLQEAKS